MIGLRILTSFCYAAIISLTASQLIAQSIDWDVKSVGVDVSFRGLYVSNEDVAWACGGKGSIYRTVNRGTTWENCSPIDHPTLEFRSIYAQDAQVAVVASAGIPAIILKTIDGGKNWREVYRNPSPHAFFDAMLFSSAKHGLAVSDPIDERWLLVATSDGGETWKDVSQEYQPPSLKSEAAFAASNGSLAYGTDATVWLGTGGNTGRSNASLLIGKITESAWSRIETPLATGESAGIFAVDFSQQPRGVIVGGDYKKESSTTSTAAWSIDGGLSWTLSQKPPSGFRSSVIFVTPQNQPGLYVAVGPNGTDISTDGKEWTKASDVGFHSVRCSPNGNLWGIGSGGRVGYFQWPRTKN